MSFRWVFANVTEVIVISEGTENTKSMLFITVRILKWYRRGQKYSTLLNTCRSLWRYYSNTWGVCKLGQISISCASISPYRIIIIMGILQLNSSQKTLWIVGKLHTHVTGLELILIGDMWSSLTLMAEDCWRKKSFLNSSSRGCISQTYCVKVCVIIISRATKTAVMNNRITYFNTHHCTLYHNRIKKNKENVDF